MIKKLTAVQEREIKIYRDKAYKYALNTRRADRGMAEKCLKYIYKRCNLKAPQIIWMDSVLGVQIMAQNLMNKGNNVADNIWKNVQDNVRKNVRNNVWNNVQDNVWNNVQDNVRKNVRNNVWKNVLNNVRNNVWNNLMNNVTNNVQDNVWNNVRGNVAKNVRNKGDIVMNNVWYNVWDNVQDNVMNNVQDNVWKNVADNVADNVAKNVLNNVMNNVRDNVQDTVWDNVWDNMAKNVHEFIIFAHSGQGGLEAYWLYYYKYFMEVLGIKHPDKEYFDVFYSLNQNCSLMLQLEEVVIVSDNPVIATVNERGQLHNSTGQAWGYADGFGLYYLNGVAVPEWLVMTPTEKLVPNEFAKIKNVEVRREFLRKIGIEKLLKGIDSKIIDTMDNYELLSVDLNLPERAKALKMINPSMGIYHVEFVPDETKTVEEALAFRNGIDTYYAPAKLT